MTYAIMCLGKELQASKFQNLSKTPSSGIYWVFLFARKAGAGQANYRLLLLSSHLQIRWHTIPAITVTINEASKSNLSTPFLSPVWGGNDIQYIIPHFWFQQYFEQIFAHIMSKYARSAVYKRAAFCAL